MNENGLSHTLMKKPLSKKAEASLGHPPQGRCPKAVFVSKLNIDFVDRHSHIGHAVPLLVFG